MKTLVLTGADANMAEINSLSSPSKAAWAARQGYDFMDVAHWAPAPAFVWQKMEAIERCLEHYERVIWLDADALVTNLAYDIEDFMVEANGSAMFISADWGGCTDEQRSFHFNTGNFITRRCEAQRAIFRDMWLLGRAKWWTKWGFEQSTLQEIKRDMPELGSWIWVLSGTSLNAVPTAAQPGTNNIWQPHHFLAHLTGISNERRLELLRNQEWRNQ